MCKAVSLPSPRRPKGYPSASIVLLKTGNQQKSGGTRQRKLGEILITNRVTMSPPIRWSEGNALFALNFIEMQTVPIPHTSTSLCASS
jgi:hypothetical protein